MSGSKLQRFSIYKHKSPLLILTNMLSTFDCTDLLQWDKKQKPEMWINMNWIKFTLIHDFLIMPIGFVFILNNTYNMLNFETHLHTAKCSEIKTQYFYYVYLLRSCAVQTNIFRLLFLHSHWVWDIV